MKKTLPLSPFHAGSLLVSDVLPFGDGQDRPQVNLQLGDEAVVEEADVDVAIPRRRRMPPKPVLDLEHFHGAGRLESPQLISERL